MMTFDSINKLTAFFSEYGFRFNDQFKSKYALTRWVKPVSWSDNVFCFISSQFVCGRGESACYTFSIGLESTLVRQIEVSEGLRDCEIGSPFF